MVSSEKKKEAKCDCSLMHTPCARSMSKKMSIARIADTKYMSPSRMPILNSDRNDLTSVRIMADACNTSIGGVQDVDIVVLDADHTDDDRDSPKKRKKKSKGQQAWR